MARNVWYVRIEDAKGVTVSEHAFPGRSIAMDRQVAQGDYRVISWRRACAGTCPASGDKGLGPLEDVCGAVVNISGGQTARVEVAINPDGSCAVSKRV